MNIKKLLDIVAELKVGKNRNNSFAKYNYRNAEDILTGLKPLMVKYNVMITVSDDIVLIGDRYYVKATVRCFDAEDGSILAESVAFAREALNKKGMDDAQVTGSASSYARKYALGGMFNLSVIADSDEIEPETAQTSLPSNHQLAAEMWNRLKASGVDPEAFARYCCKTTFHQIPADRLQNLADNFDATVDWFKKKAV